MTEEGRVEWLIASWVAWLQREKNLVLSSGVLIPCHSVCPGPLLEDWDIISPKDVIGCLNVKATMYEMYSVSYDIHCTGFKAMLR